MLLSRGKYVYLDSFKTTCTHITTTNTQKKVSNWRECLNRRLFFTVPICVKKLFKILRDHFEKIVGPQLNYRLNFSLDFQRWAKIFCDLFSTHSETCWPECNDVLKVTKNKILSVQHREKRLHSYHVNFKKSFKKLYTIIN
jgi:hypothetical protein